MRTFQLFFPTEVTAEAVASVLRTAAAESRGSLVRTTPPAVLETVLTNKSTTWWLSAPGSLARSLQVAAEHELPGMTFAEATRPQVPVVHAVELQARSGERRLTADLAEGAIRRLLGIGATLQSGETLLIQWQVGTWLHRSPVPAASAAEPRTIWNLPEWGNPVRDSEQIAELRKKQSEHVFAAIGRIAVGGARHGRAAVIAADAVNAYQLLRAPGVGISRRWLPSWLVRRRLHRARVPRLDPALRLTPTELAAVVGWPVGNPVVRGVRYVAARTLDIDERCLTISPRPTDRLIGAASSSRQSDRLVRIGTQASLRHLHVVGPSGAGKSTVLAQLILSDIRAGRGVVVIDPKGDLVTDVLERVPDRTRNQIVVLDPSDVAPVGFNPVSGGTLGVDSVLHVLRSIWASSWGPRMADVLHAGLLTLAASPGHGLPELPLLLTDAGFRRPLVARAVAQDPIGLGTFWPAFEALSDEARLQVLAPVMNKLRAFLLRPDLRAVLGQAKPRIDLQSVFTERRAVLVRLPKGDLGTEGAQLLGSLLVAHLWRLGLRRAAIPRSQRHPVFIYLDEFQEFLRLPMDLPDVLVQARGLGIGLVLAHQHLGQLDPGVRSAVLANAGSRMAFRLDHDDAQVIAKRSGGRVRPEDFMALRAFEAYTSILVEDETTPYGSLVTRPLAEPTNSSVELLKRNRELWGVPRTDTEQRLRDLVAGTAGATIEAGPLGGRPAAGGPR